MRNNNNNIDNGNNDQINNNQNNNGNDDIKENIRFDIDMDQLLFDEEEKAFLGMLTLKYSSYSICLLFDACL